MKTVIEFITILVDGGSQVVVKNYVETINRNDVSLMVLTVFPHKTSAVQRAIVQMGIPVISLYPRYNLFFRAVNRIFSKQITSFLLLRKIQRVQPYAIHVHAPLLKLLEPIRDSIKNIKLFYTCHSLPQVYFSGRNEIEKRAAKHLICDNGLQIFALHKEMADELNRLLNINNTIVLNNGINIERYKYVKESKREIRESLNILPDTYVVGHVGRFDKIKNQMFLIDIFIQLLRYRDAHLILVGDGEDGPLFSKIKKKIEKVGLQKKVTILTHRNDVHRLLKAFDIFIFPSLYEGFGLALLEAQAAGLRCVISDTISDVTRVLDSTVGVSLNKPAEYWCNTVLDEDIRQPHTSTLEDYDIFKIIKRLQRYYLG